MKGRDGTVIEEKVDKLVCSPSQIWVALANGENYFASLKYRIHHY